jgi:catechol 2,3-dioxygenase-like lactoylglutathione lyase family enzyme
MPDLAMIALVVRDYDEAIDWYSRALGFEVLEDTPMGSKRWVVLGSASAGCRLLLARADTDEQRARIGDQCGGRVFLFLETHTFDADHERMKAAGARFVEEPRTEPYGTVAVFEDLYGNRCDLIQPAATG